jgi:hypothetical protein
LLSHTVCPERTAHRPVIETQFPEEVLKMIESGKKAPEFCLASAQRENVCLKDDKGKWVVLFFYVKDNTGG